MTLVQNATRVLYIVLYSVCSSDLWSSEVICPRRTGLWLSWLLPSLAFTFQQHILRRSQVVHSSYALRYARTTGPQRTLCRRRKSGLNFQTADLSSSQRGRYWEHLIWGPIHAGLAIEVRVNEGSADEYQRNVDIL
eukprot:428637-Prymnesium_polylepis.1